MILRTCALAAMLLLGIAASAKAQDSELWLEGSLELRQSKRFRLVLRHQLRLNDGMSDFDSLRSEVMPVWRIKKWIRLEGAYRLIYGRDGATGDPQLWHRLTAGVRFDAEIDRLELDARARFQEQFRLERQDEFEHTVRLRGRVAVRIVEPVRVYGSFELFTRLADDEDDVRLHKWRSFVGVRYEPGRGHSFAIAGGYEGYFRDRPGAFLLSASFAAMIEI